MMITVIVRSAGSEGARLTFDGTQRIVIGRGPGSDVRLPHASVSHRHATLRAQGAEFVLMDEGSTNGTFVGAVRIAPNTSRLVRSGDAVRVGRIWLELRLDRSPVTRDLAAATRDLALALVSEAIVAAGTDPTKRIRVVEGVDQGSTLPLARVGHEYLVGRAPHCDLVLTDLDVSREHMRVARFDDAVVIVDAGAKNGTSVGESRVGARQPAVWRPPQMVKIGATVLSLEEPLSEALARIESVPDERLAPEEAGVLDVHGAPGLRGLDPSAAGRVPEAVAAAGPSESGAPASHGGSVVSEPESAGPAPGPVADPANVVPHAGGSLRRGAGEPRWSVVDVTVMAAAVGILAVSLAGLVWLFRGY